jgi:Ca2+-binding EF-hand superfamily protein
MMIGTALLALATPAFAQAPAAPANANITRAQVVAELNAAFGRVDTNKDGVITVAEANAAQQRVAAERAKEIEQGVAAQFAKLDKDKNGQLSLAEFKAGSPPVRLAGGEQVLNLLDTNKDGKVTSAEFQAQRLRAFDSVDTNHDGTVTQLERQAAAQVR